MTVQTETHLVLLLNQLCSRLMERENAHLLDLFFNGGIEGSESTGMDTTRICNEEIELLGKQLNFFKIFHLRTHRNRRHRALIVIKR